MERKRGRPRTATEEAKNIKITASTHARLLMLTNIFDKTVSAVIDDMIATLYPEIIDETNKTHERWASLRQTLEARQHTAANEQTE